MKRSHRDNRASRETDERLDALVEEALREIARPAAADVKPRVMAEWDEHSLPFRLRKPRSRPWSPPPPFLKPAAALAGALVIVIAMFVTWQQADRSLQEAERAREQPRTAGSSGGAGETADKPQVPPGGVAERTAAPEDAAATIPRAATPDPSLERRSAARRSRPRPPALEWPVEELATAEEFGSMPGAPAGELGDAFASMPRRPAIEIAPIVPAPTIAAMARPVTDFPTDDQPPGTPAADPGNSQGERR